MVSYPGGFELDHKVPLFQGGADTDENCQILCVRFEVVEGRSVKAGCHAEKTQADGPPA
ncbi:HNH endonuclease [compost metagenome]